MDEKVRKWLSNSKQELYQSNRTSREKISYFLTRIGFSVDEIKNAKSLGQDNDKIFSMTKLVLIDSILVQENNHNILLSDDIDLFLFKSNLNDLFVVIDVDTSSIQSSLLDSVIFYKDHVKDAMSPRGYGDDMYSSVELLGVIIHNDSLKIIFSEPSSPMQHNLLEFTVNVPAKILRIENSPSLFTLYGLGNSKVKELHDGQVLNELKNIYGELPTEDAKNLIAEDYAKSYKNVEVFGISFPTSNFVYAVLFFLFMIYLGINHTINLCIKHKIRIFSKVEGDELIEPFIESELARFCNWVILPFVCVVFSTPLIQSGFDSFIIVSVLLFVICILFYLVFRKSLEGNKKYWKK